MRRRRRWQRQNLELQHQTPSNPDHCFKNSFESARAARGLGRFLLRCRRRGWHLGGPYYHTFTSEADTSQRKRIDPRGCVSTEAYPSRMEKYEDRLQLPNFKPISICALGLQSSRQPGFAPLELARPEAVVAQCLPKLQTNKELCRLELESPSYEIINSQPQPRLRQDTCRFRARCRGGWRHHVGLQVNLN